MTGGGGEGTSGYLQLLLGTFIYLLVGAVAYPLQKSPFHQVTGSLGNSALFPVKITSGKTVLMFKWDMDPQTAEPYELAVFVNGRLKPSNPDDGCRLDMANETTLRIKALQENETGVLKAQVRYTTYETEEFLFNLTVFVTGWKNRNSSSYMLNTTQVERERWRPLICIPATVGIVACVFLYVLWRLKKRPERLLDTDGVSTAPKERSSPELHHPENTRSSSRKMKYEQVDQNDDHLTTRSLPNDCKLGEVMGVHPLRRRHLQSAT